MAITREINLCTKETKEERATDRFDESTRLETFMKNFCTVAHFIVNYDIFSIYKGDYEHASKSKYSLHLRPELRMPLTNTDKWRRRVRLFWSAAYVPFVIRMSMLCIVQLAKYQATTYELREPADDRRGGSSGALMQPVEIETELIKFLKRYKLYYWFGNALSEFPGLMLTIYITLFISFTYSNYYMPFYHFKRDPIDAIDMRVGLKPSQERSRADLMLRERMEALLVNTLEETPLIQSHSQFARHAPTLHQYVQLHRENTRQLRYQPMGKLRARFTFDPALRSSRYSAERPRIFWYRSYYSVGGVTLVGTWFAHVLQSNLVYWSTRVKCQTRRLPANQCIMLNALTLDEIYAIFELLLIIYAFGYTAVVSSIDMAVLSWCQRMAISETKSALNDLLCALKLLNHLKVDQRSPFAGGLTADMRKCVGQKEPYLRDALLKVLVKTSVFREEFIAQAGFISELASGLVVLFGTALVLALTTGKMNGPDLEDLRSYIIRFLWIVANLWLVLCASQFASVTKLQKGAWSILAQLYERKKPNRPHSAATDSALDEPTLMAWRKFVQGGCFTDALCSIRPFGVSLTFKQILEMNFWVFSLAALVFR